MFFNILAGRTQKAHFACRGACHCATGMTTDSASAYRSLTARRKMTPERTLRLLAG
jgi:hypothetical protein